MRHLRPAVVTVGACALAAGLTTMGTPAAQAVSPTTGKLEILLDASGSMADPAGDGRTKIAAARSALNTMVDGMQDGSRVGMRVYGATAPPGKDTREACSDSQQVVPVSTLDRSALKSAIHRYAPKGQTPTAYALRKAADDLGTTGQRSIVLVSDGESTCSPDPCDTAKDLAAEGIDLRVDVIGFKVGKKARSQLNCISTATNGKYFDASDTAGLTTALETVKTRANQPFSVAGKAIVGARSSGDAPDIGAGHWTDTVPADGRTAKYYRLRHSMTGSSFMVGVTARPKVKDSQVKLSVSAPDGTSCGSTSPTAMGMGHASRELLTGVLSTAPRGDWSTSCTSDDLILKVEQSGWGDDAAGTPMQLDVTETPEPTNASILKHKTDTDTTWVDMPQQGAKSTTAGGSGLASAPRLQPGTTSVELVPGELKFFRVSAGWGQQVQAVATAEENPAYASTSSFRRLSADILSPAGGDATAFYPKDMPKGDSGSWSNTDLITDDGGRVAAATTPIRMANRASYSDHVVATSIAGDYYVVVGLSTLSSGSDTVQTPLKVDLQVGTPGTAAQEAPEFAAGQAVKTSASTVLDTKTGRTEKAGTTHTGTSQRSGAKAHATESATSGPGTAQAAGVPGARDGSGTNWTLIGGLSGGAGLLAILGAGAAFALHRRG